ncbi:hypothetical protein Sjap_008237 [Stephania japonica]|uniref:Uncharacterized protein n=1 Tax=Stephania japonica TaxID=461633 RepID=A0AAP0JQP2_9MAGN
MAATLGFRNDGRHGNRWSGLLRGWIIIEITTVVDSSFFHPFFFEVGVTPLLCSSYVCLCGCV